VRQRFDDAAKAEAAGRLDEALQLFAQARAGANAHWRALIDDRQRLLREQTYRSEIRRSSTAADVATKLDALLRAAAAMGRPSPELAQLLRYNPTLAADAQVQARLAEIDAAQLAAARAARSRQAWSEYLADHPQGAGAAEAQAMLARMDNP